MRDFDGTELSRNFEGIWLPAHVWEREDLAPREVVLLAEITSLDKGEGCYASDEWLARRAKVSKGRLKNMLTSLRDRGLIETLKFDGRRRWLRSYYWMPNKQSDSSSHEKVTAHVTKTGQHTSRKSDTENTIKKTKRNELPASGAIGKSPLYELVNHPVKHQTGFSEAINLFHAFAKSRNFHTRGEKQGKTIYVKNAHEGGWRRQALLEWESRYQALLKRTGSEERIIKTLKWFIANFDNPWVPHCEAFSTFADRFGSIDKMRRRETGESQAFRNGEYKGKNGAPKIKYDMIDGRKVANYEEFV